MKTFTCPVDGNPEPNIEWYNEKNGARISNRKQLTVGESGCYTCVANNSLGASVTITQCLTVGKSARAHDSLFSHCAYGRVETSESLALSS